MPTFDTPEPISATIDLAIGDVRISAGDRGATVVEVHPSDASNEEDRQGRRADPRRVRERAAAGQGAEAALLAEQERRRVDRRDDRAARRLARARRRWGWGTSTATAGSATAGSRPASVASGSTGPTRCNLKSGAGDISVDRATGHAEVTAGSGDVRLGELDSSAVIKNSNGDTWVGVAGGDLRVNAANGSIAVDLAHASVVAKSANGDVRLGEVVRGSVVLETKIGDLEVGIREGTAAWLDVQLPVRSACTTPWRPPTPPSRRPRPSRCALAPPSARS